MSPSSADLTIVSRTCCARVLARAAVDLTHWRPRWMELAAVNQLAVRTCRDNSGHRTNEHLLTGRTAVRKVSTHCAGVSTLNSATSAACVLLLDQWLLRINRRVDEEKCIQHRITMLETDAAAAEAATRLLLFLITVTSGEHSDMMNVMAIQ